MWNEIQQFVTSNNPFINLHGVVLYSCRERTIFVFPVSKKILQIFTTLASMQ